MQEFAIKKKKYLRRIKQLVLEQFRKAGFSDYMRFRKTGNKLTLGRKR